MKKNARMKRRIKKLKAKIAKQLAIKGNIRIDIDTPNRDNIYMGGWENQGPYSLKNN